MHIEMGGAYSTTERYAILLFSQKIKRRENLADLGVDGRILQWIIKEGVKVYWTQLAKDRDQ
jgi:hypothetical protein